MTIDRRFDRRAACAAICVATILAWPGPAKAQPPAPQRSSATSQHETKIILLGTKAGPSIIAARSETAVLLLVDGKRYLIDAGTGTTRQIARTGYDVTSVSTIFITHDHLDHIGGLGSVVSNIAAHRQYVKVGQKSPPLTIYGPSPIKALIDASLQFAIVHDRLFHADMPSLAPFDPRLYVTHEITHGGLVYKDDGVTVTAVENTHYQHPSYGPDGTKDMSFSYRFDTPSGSIAFTGDTGPSDAVARLATGADVLISEVYQPYVGSMVGALEPGSAQAKARIAELVNHMKTEHLTPHEIGKMAARAHVKVLILYHIAAVYDARNLAAMRAGIQRWFHGELIIGNDFTTFDMNPGRYAVDQSGVH